MLGLIQDNDAGINIDVFALTALDMLQGTKFLFDPSNLKYLVIICRKVPLNY